MSELDPNASESGSTATSTGVGAPPSSNGTTNLESGGADFSERYSEVIGKVNETLEKVDWSQVGKIGKATGILIVVIVAQILIKGVIDTINLLPVVPGLLQLLGLVVVGQWSWQNLTTSEKRAAVVQRLQGLRKDYLG